MDALMVTAIGHTADETILDRLADKRFNLPHDYGVGLHVIAEKLFQEKSNSRALLIDEFKKYVKKQFSEQVETLEKQLKEKRRVPRHRKSIRSRWRANPKHLQSSLGYATKNFINYKPPHPGNWKSCRKLSGSTETTSGGTGPL